MKDFIQKRNYTLDVIRIVAVLAVIMIHCTAPYVTGYASHSVEFVCGVFFNGISRFGVPLFLMISGALFLNESKEISLTAIISKNVKSIAILTVTWAAVYSLVYNVISPVLKGDSVHLNAVMAGIASGHGHMWYLYMIMGLYVITPFLKKFVSKENKSMVLFFIAVSFVVQFLVPVVDGICILFWDRALVGPWLNIFHLDFFGGYITYYLVGWYIVHVGIQQKRKKYLLYCLGICSLVFMVLYVWFTRGVKTVYADLSASVFLYSVSLFLMLTGKKFELSEKAAKAVTELSKLTFGVYIVHVLVLSVFNELFVYRGHFVLHILLCFVSVTCGSFLCASVMSKIPFIKKLIKM